MNPEKKQAVRRRKFGPNPKTSPSADWSLAALAEAAACPSSEKERSSKSVLDRDPRQWSEEDKAAFEDLWFNHVDLRQRGYLTTLTNMLWTMKGIRKTSPQVRSFKQKWLIRKRKQGYTDEQLLGTGKMTLGDHHFSDSRPSNSPTPQPVVEHILIEPETIPDQAGFVEVMKRRTQFWATPEEPTGLFLPQPTPIPC